MYLPIARLIAVQLLLLTTAHLSTSVLLADETIRFSTDVRPIFNLHCAGCHGGVKAAGDLKITDSQAVAAIVTPGNALESALFERVNSDDDEFRMPPPEHGPKLSTSDIKIIRDWINQGAKWEFHWSFEPLTQPSLPPPSFFSTRSNLSYNSRIDYFWADELAKRKLSPAQTSAPNLWLRRVTLALTGLSPQPEDYDQFAGRVASHGEQAYEEVVDRLLASPAYGEHWASVWLDQIRYADSRGLGQDGPRTMWKYRDWVIDAINSDMPFDDFTLKQIAGDLLPEASFADRVATTANRLTQTNEEGGTDDEEFRIAAVIDRVNTLWQVWHGTTFGCVQCHDHPYDPFRHDEYYKFLSYFNNTADWDLTEEFPLQNVPVDRNDYSKYDQLDRQLRQRQESLWRDQFKIVHQSSSWQPLSGLTVTTNNSTQAVLSKIEAQNEFHTQGTVQRNTEYNIEWKSDKERNISAIRVNLRPLHPETAARDSEWGAVISHIQFESKLPNSDKWDAIPVQHVVADEPFPFFAPEESLNRESTQGFGAYSRIMHDRKAAFVFKEPIAIHPGSQLRIKMAHRVSVFRCIPTRGKKSRY